MKQRDSEKREKNFRKEVKRMKKIGVLVIALIFMAITTTARAEVDLGIITSLAEKIVSVTFFNAFGAALKAITATTTTTTTSREGAGSSTTIEESTVSSTWRGGSLKTDTVDIKSDTEATDDSTSHQDYTDTYAYDGDGKLKGGSGSGKSNSYDGETKHTTQSTITREFMLGDGQLLLTSQVTKGSEKDKNGKEIADFSEKTTMDDYKYLGGNWVIMKQTSTSSSEGKDGSSQWITRTTTYARTEDSVITGLDRTASGHQVRVIGQNGDDTARQEYTLNRYDVDTEFHSQLGWYISKEEIEWKMIPREPHDPWTKGTLAIIDGHLALIADPDDVKGSDFYKMDPSEVTGATKKDEDGNLIFMLGVDNPETQAALQTLVGKEINLMWQYYTKSSNENASGYGWIWLAPTSDSRVASHLQNDNASQVQQWGGDWDRSKQYVVID